MKNEKKRKKKRKGKCVYQICKICISVGLKNLGLEPVYSLVRQIGLSGCCLMCRHGQKTKSLIFGQKSSFTLPNSIYTIFPFLMISKGQKLCWLIFDGSFENRPIFRWVYELFITQSSYTDYKLNEK